MIYLIYGFYRAGVTCPLFLNEVSHSHLTHSHHNNIYQISNYLISVSKLGHRGRREIKTVESKLIPLYQRDGSCDNSIRPVISSSELRLSDFGPTSIGFLMKALTK